MSVERWKAQRRLGSTLDRLRGLEAIDRTWLRIASEMLKFCRDNEPSARAWELSPGEPWDTIAAAQVRIGSIFVAHDPALGPGPLSGFAPAEVLGRMADQVRVEIIEASGSDFTDEMAAIVVAHAAAAAIDEHYGETFEEHFAAELDLRITDGQPFPKVARPLLATGNNVALNTRPEKLPTRRLDDTRRLGIGRREHMRYEFVLDWDTWGRTAPLANDEPLVIAVLQPHLSLRSFHIHGLDPSESTFRNLGPSDERSNDLIVELVTAAAREGAGLVILHEYAVTEGMWDELVMLIGQALHKPILMIAGVAGGDDDPAGIGTNEARLLYPSLSGPSLEKKAHSKLHPAELGDATERVIPGSEVRVFVSQDWAIAVLLCRDAMAGPIIEALAEIGVGLLVVPAMSRKTAGLGEVASRISTASQGVVVVANGPIAWTSDDAVTERLNAARSEVVIAGPYASVPLRMDVPVAGSGPQAVAEGFWILHCDSRTAVWREW